jgi:hypothetical protein
MNEYFISKRLEISIDICGSEKRLREIGFDGVMGFESMVEQLNEMNFFEVENILKNLIFMGGLNKDFAVFLINSDFLDENKFYKKDDMFNMSEENLLKLIYKNENIELNEEIEEIEADEIERIYKKYSSNKKEPTKKNVDIEKYINKEYNYKLSKFKENLDLNVYNWMENNLKNMPAEDYGMFLYLINKIRENGTK